MTVTAQSAQPAISWFCIDATAVDDIDYSAAATLREVYKMLKEKGVRLVMVYVDEDIRRELDVSGVTELIGKEALFETIPDVEDAYRKTTSSDKELESGADR